MDWLRTVTVDDAPIDTGSLRTLLPRSLADHLGLVIMGSERVQHPIVCTPSIIPSRESRYKAK